MQNIRLLPETIVALPLDQIPLDRRIDLTKLSHTDLVTCYRHTAMAFYARFLWARRELDRRQIWGGLELVGQELMRRLEQRPPAPMNPNAAPAKLGGAPAASIMPRPASGTSGAPAKPPIQRQVPRGRPRPHGIEL